MKLNLEYLFSEPMVIAKAISKALDVEPNSAEILSARFMRKKKLIQEIESQLRSIVVINQSLTRSLLLKRKLAN